jgi:hypothetical protein
MGRQFRKLEASVQRDIHELFTRSAGDLLDHMDQAFANARRMRASPQCRATPLSRC